MLANTDLWALVNVGSFVLAAIWLARVSWATRFYWRMPWKQDSPVAYWGFGVFWMTVSMNARLLFWGPIRRLTDEHWNAINPLGNDFNILFHVLAIVAAHAMLVGLRKIKS